MKDNQIIGIARLLGDGVIYWYINDVWVLPQYQGKGIGKNMVERIIQYVKDICEVSVTLSTENKTL